jgi:hypothetical protein
MATRMTTLTQLYRILSDEKNMRVLLLLRTLRSIKQELRHDPRFNHDNRMIESVPREAWPAACMSPPGLPDGSG